MDIKQITLTVPWLEPKEECLQICQSLYAVEHFLHDVLEEDCFWKNVAAELSGEGGDQPERLHGVNHRFRLELDRHLGGSSDNSQ